MPTITGSNITIMVKDMDKSIQFYQNIGLELKQRWDNHYAMLTAGGMTIGLHPSDDSKHGGGSLSSGSTSIGFFVPDIKEVEKMLDGLKIKHESIDDGESGIYCHFTDLDGTVLYFVQPKWS
jgi:catechol 2,3-dioxygenase-like lactoylglutathione lyase family enzyme